MGVWIIPEGLRVLADGSWMIGELPVLHEPTLRYLKQRLVFEDGGAFVVDGLHRMPVAVQGPAFTVTALAVADGAVRLRLDDGSEETLVPPLETDARGRFLCRVRGGRARAVFSRAAHQAVIDHLDRLPAPA